MNGPLLLSAGQGSVKGRHRIVNGDVLDFARQYRGPQFQALLCDPPYHLTSITKRFGGRDAAPAKFGKDGAFARASRGFMGTTWDGGDLAFQPETWEAFGNIMLDGAFGMAFASTRGYHRMACAIEDAGFIIHPMICWAFGCLSEDTEILTIDGWKKGIDVQKGEIVATWNNQTCAIELSPVREKTLAPYDGELIRLRNTQTDQLLTPNHRVYLKRINHFSECWTVTEAENISGTISLPTSGEHSGTGIGGADYAALLAWIWTEGSFDKTRGRIGIRICQSSVNSEKVSEIDRLMDGLVGYHARYISNRKYKTSAYQQFTWYFSGEMAKKIRSDLPQKKPTWDLLWRMTLEEKKAFLNAAVAGDGTPRPFWTLVQYDDFGKEWFQTLCHMVGIKARVSWKRKYVSLCNGSTTQIRPTRKGVTRQQYTGFVWCVSVDNHAFVARRNGKIFITGNSGFPKATRVKDDDRFAGHRYGLQSLKPALEPICLFQRPYNGRPVDNIISSGAGTLAIAGARIGTDTHYNNGGLGENRNLNDDGWSGVGRKSYPSVVEGRWPANLVLGHSADCTPQRCAPDCAVALMSEQSGLRAAGGNIVDAQSEPFANIYSGRMNRQRNYEGFGDSGTAARFYHNVEWAMENAEPFFYTAKASSEERNRGLEGMDETLIGDGRTKAIDNAYQRGKTLRVNPHPTIKPIALTTWLAKLLLPPVEFGPRRLFIPFAGVMSEGIGALKAGWETIYAVESSKDYCDIGRMRFDYYAARTQGILPGFEDAIQGIYGNEHTMKSDFQEGLRQQSFFEMSEGV